MGVVMDGAPKATKKLTGSVRAPTFPAQSLPRADWESSWAHCVVSTTVYQLEPLSVVTPIIPPSDPRGHIGRLRIVTAPAKEPRSTPSSPLTNRAS